MGFEPTTSAVTGRRSNQLSHRAIKIMSILRSYLLRTISLSHIFYFQVLDVPSKHHTKPFSHFAFFWSKPRPISDSQLHALPHFHLCPIYLVVFKGSYYLSVWEILSLGGLHA